MKILYLGFLLSFLWLFQAQLVYAQTVTPTNTPTKSSEVPTQSGSSILNSFISGFDWISSGLIFSTPSILDSTIKLQDGTELTGMSIFRNIFYDIAVPLFVLITSFVAFSHITNDNAVQLQQFFKRMLVIVVLFIITPAILSYSIQFVNLLNEKIIASNAYNLSTLVNNFLNGFTQIPTFQQQFGISVFLPSWSTVLQLIIFIISIGFLLIGFIYIVFQAVIRFIALLVLSVIFPVVLPFALSQKTENITNTYFRTWFSFLIQQPAFVLGFAIVSAILTSISQAHNNSIGTLFIYSGSLIFLGSINVFIGRIFGEGWAFVTTNAQSMISAHTVNKGAVKIARNENVMRIPAYTGKAISGSAKTFAQGIQKFAAFKGGNATTQERKQKIEIMKRDLLDKKSAMGIPNHDTSVKQKIDTATHTTKHYDKKEERKTPATSQKENEGNQTKTPKLAGVATRRENTIKPIAVKRPVIKRKTTEKERPISKVPRRKVSL